MCLIELFLVLVQSEVIIQVVKILFWKKTKQNWNSGFWVDLRALHFG